MSGVKLGKVFIHIDLKYGIDFLTTYGWRGYERSTYIFRLKIGFLKFSFCVQQSIYIKSYFRSVSKVMLLWLPPVQTKMGRIKFDFGARLNTSCAHCTTDCHVVQETPNGSLRWISVVEADLVVKKILGPVI